MGDDSFWIDQLHVLVKQEATVYRLSNYIQDGHSRPRHPTLNDKKDEPICVWKHGQRQRMVLYMDQSK